MNQSIRFFTIVVCASMSLAFVRSVQAQTGPAASTGRPVSTARTAQKPITPIVLPADSEFRSAALDGAGAPPQGLASSTTATTDGSIILAIAAALLSLAGTALLVGPLSARRLAWSPGRFAGRLEARVIPAPVAAGYAEPVNDLRSLIATFMSEETERDDVGVIARHFGRTRSELALAARFEEHRGGTEGEHALDTLVAPGISPDDQVTMARELGVGRGEIALASRLHVNDVINRKNGGRP